MDKYIEREAVIEDCTFVHGRFDDKYISETAVKAIPTADVVKVVRCKDCKWFQCNLRPDGYLPNGVSEFECRHWCGECDPTDYCSHGEKIEVDE